MSYNTEELYKLYVEYQDLAFKIDSCHRRHEVVMLIDAFIERIDDDYERTLETDHFRALKCHQLSPYVEYNYVVWFFHHDPNEDPHTPSARYFVDRDEAIAFFIDKGILVHSITARGNTPVPNFLVHIWRQY